MMKKMKEKIVLIWIFIAVLLCQTDAKHSEVYDEENTINTVSRSRCSLDADGFNACDDVEKKLTVKYGSSSAVCKTELTKSQAAEAPSVTYSVPDEDENEHYTLIMVDPDAPDPKGHAQRYWLHWIVTDIPGSKISSGDVSGNVVTEYNGPTPPTGTHRYQLLLFKQPGQSLSVTAPANRGKFSLNDFMQKHGLCDSLKAGFQYKVSA